LPLPDGNDANDQSANSELVAHRRYVEEAWIRYTLRRYDGKVAIVWPVDGPSNPPWDPRALWIKYTPDFDWRMVPGNHWSMLHEHLAHSARALGEFVQSGGAS
jgi:thioesterase domain-containing protein